MFFFYLHIEFNAGIKLHNIFKDANFKVFLIQKPYADLFFF